MGSYILHTAAKDEAENLPRLIAALRGQTLRPKAWFISDDGSTDGTADVLAKAAEEMDWINVRRLKSGERALGMHVARLHQQGIEWALGAQGDDVDYVGVLDADMVPGPEFFECLVGRLDRDPSVGLAAGAVTVNGRVERISRDPRGGARLLRHEALKAIGGIPVTWSYDTVTTIKLRHKGWKAVTGESCRVEQVRPTASARGRFRGQIYHGRSFYALGGKPFRCLAWGLGRIHPLKVAGFLVGYLGAAARRIPRSTDPVVRAYFGLNAWQVLSKAMGKMRMRRDR